MIIYAKWKIEVQIKFLSLVISFQVIIYDSVIFYRRKKGMRGILFIFVKFTFIVTPLVISNKHTENSFWSFQLHSVRVL